MVKPNRCSAWSEEHGNSVADNDGSRVVDLKPLAAMQLHGEYAKRLTQSQTVQHLIKVLGRHEIESLEAANRVDHTDNRHPSIDSLAL